MKTKEQIKMKFKDAPVGARFKYPNAEGVWVKLNSYPEGIYGSGDGLVCRWNGNVKGYQAFCSFVDEEEGINFDTEIELIESFEESEMLDEPSCDCVFPKPSAKDSFICRKCKRRI